MKRLCFFLAILLLASHNLVMASTASTLEVEGFGDSIGEARMDAIRNALNQTVRQLIITDRRIENQELVLDRVLTTANGFISNFRLLESHLLEGGTVRIRAKVTVATRQIENFIAYGDFDSSTVDGESLFAEAQRQQMQTRMATQILNRALSGYPAYAHDIELKSIRPRSGSSFEMTIDIQPVSSFFESLKQTIAAISVDTMHRRFSRRESYGLREIAYDVDTKAPMTCVAEGAHGEPPWLFWTRADCGVLPEGSYPGGTLKDQSPEPVLLIALLDRKGQTLHDPPGCAAVTWSDGSRFMLGSFFDVKDDPERRFIPGGTRRLVIGSTEDSRQFALNAPSLNIADADQLVGMKVLASREYARSQLPAGTPWFDRPTLYFPNLMGPGKTPLHACRFLLDNSMGIR